jgi:hypothetical protein
MGLRSRGNCSTIQRIDYLERFGTILKDGLRGARHRRMNEQ